MQIILFGMASPKPNQIETGTQTGGDARGCEDLA
jgi:hypothetical protein